VFSENGLLVVDPINNGETDRRSHVQRAVKEENEVPTILVCSTVKESSPCTQHCTGVLQYLIYKYIILSTGTTLYWIRIVLDGSGFYPKNVVPSVECSIEE
jgi:hypothetical protein